MKFITLSAAISVEHVVLALIGYHSGKLQQQGTIQQEERTLQEGPRFGSLGGDCYPKLSGER